MADVLKYDGFLPLETFSNRSAMVTVLHCSFFFLPLITQSCFLKRRLFQTRCKHSQCNKAMRSGSANIFTASPGPSWSLWVSAESGWNEVYSEVSSAGAHPHWSWTADGERAQAGELPPARGRASGGEWDTWACSLICPVSISYGVDTVFKRPHFLVYFSWFDKCKDAGVQF